MKTITLSILDSEEEAVMKQLHEWQQRRAVRFEFIDPLLVTGEPLTPAEWAEELRRSEASGSVTLTHAEALARFVL